MTGRIAQKPNHVAGLVLVVGAGGYALAVGGLDVTFSVTPLWFGGSALVAGIAARQPRLVSIACPLIAWGLAVLLVRDGPIPANRTAAAYLVGSGLGMLAASIWAKHHGISTVGAALSVVSGGLGFYFAYDVDALGRWPVWAVLLVVWAIVEAIRPSDRAAPDVVERATT